MSVGFIDFLRNWGESLFTSKKKFIAQQPLPNVLHSQQSVSTGDGVYQDFVSPVDGFVTIDTEQKESGIRFRMMVKKTAGYLVGTSFYKGTDSTYSAYLPVSKGDTVSFTYTKSNSSLLLSWISSIGGGA